MMSSSNRPGFAFFSLLVILVWAPLPFASNVLWAEMLLCVLVFSLTLFVLSRQLLATNGAARCQHLGKSFWLAFLALLSAQLFVALQLVPSVLGIEFPFDTIDPQATTVHLLTGLSLCCMFFLVATLITTKQEASLLLLTLVACGVFQASYGAVMTLSGLEYGFFAEKDVYRGVATGTFVNRNHLAGYLVLTLACGIGLMIANSNRREFRDSKDFFRSLISAVVTGKGALRISLLVMVIGLVLTKSRMGNVSFLVALSISGILILLTSRIPKKTIAMFIASIFVVDALIIGTFFDLDKLAERLEATTAQTENRDEIFRLAIPLISDNLPMGNGAGTFYTAYPEFRDESVGGGFYVHAHSDYVEFLSDRGLIGTLPLVVFFLLCLKEVRRLSTSTSMNKKGLAFTILMSMVGIVLHSTVDFNLQMPVYALTLVAIWAIFFSSPYAKNKEQ